MKIDRYNPFLVTLATLLAVCQADDAAEPSEEEETWFQKFLNNSFFQQLYDLLPNVQPQWLVLLIFGGGALLAAILVLWVLKCLCCSKPAEPVPSQGKAIGSTPEVTPAPSTEYGQQPAYAYGAQPPQQPVYGYGAQPQQQQYSGYYSGSESA
eukprot:CAMPEP_0178919634 /NCGR_PEP_ID=MMETSP0786-20121207/14549_1 /TAXON_ID=186022 /ORGANISM="Thalassionema frauenfeldii, Strain CCMP 1798" /LENGTH=152 /DNA_ID=CAMNT_0020593593 /DNA_START=50 /DNA_END=508 /DNA_ORIENTATION=-